MLILEEARSAAEATRRETAIETREQAVKLRRRLDVSSLKDLQSLSVRELETIFAVPKSDELIVACRAIECDDGEVAVSRLPGVMLARYRGRFGLPALCRPAHRGVPLHSYRARTRPDVPA